MWPTRGSLSYRCLPNLFFQPCVLRMLAKLPSDLPFHFMVWMEIPNSGASIFVGCILRAIARLGGCRPRFNSWMPRTSWSHSFHRDIHNELAERSNELRV